MQTPVRILRRDIEDIPGARPIFSPRELARRDLILAAASRVLARHGRTAITIASLAGALCLPAGAIRRHFADMDSLLASILLRHVDVIAQAIGAQAIGGIGGAGPECFARRRAAYLAMTRSSLGGLTEAHLLLVRDRQTLPPDLLDEVERRRTGLGERLAGTDAVIALNLLDMAELSPHQIEACLASIAPPAALPAALPDLRRPRLAAQPVQRQSLRQHTKPQAGRKHPHPALCAAGGTHDHPMSYAARAGPG